MREASSSGLAGVAAAAAQGRGLPPVHLWNPPHCGDIDIRIRRDGVWEHEGRPIAREALVRLFSTVLRLDPDGHHLVTPVEKLRIRVDDAPFIAVALERAGGALRFTTNVGDVVEAGPEHALSVEGGERDEPAPYIHVRRGLRARLTRPVFYELVDMAELRDGVLGVVSNNAWFALGVVDAPAA